MKILVDGIIYSLQSNGGISRLYREVLPRICEQHDTVEISMYVAKPYRQILPQHERIKHVHLLRRDLRPARLFQAIRPQVDQFILSMIGDHSGLWFSTYHTLPPFRPRAIIMPVYDLVYERYRMMFNLKGEERLRQQIKRSITEADLVACISQTTANDVIQMYGISPAKIKIIPLASSPFFKKVQPDDILSLLPTPKPFLLYVGGRLKHKNFSEFINAYACWTSRKTVDLIVVGDRWTSQEKQRLGELNVANQVHLLTGVDDDLLRDLYHQAVAFVYPSLWEGFGIPLLEAMACGCPIISSDIPSSREVAQDYPTYFELGHVESLHAAMDHVLSEMNTMTLAAKADKILSQYSWDTTANKLLEVFREVDA